jgi:hypothetical protein
MATQKQIDANRRNALRSTGPKTPAGKTISSRNALKHGLRARAALLPGEDKQAFERLFNAFRAEHRPAGRFEEVLVEQMAVAYWKLSRLTRIESHLYHDKATPADLFSGLRDPYLCTQDQPDPRPNEPKLTPDQLITRVFIQDASGFNTFSRLSYYEMRLERSFYRAHHELERLRAKRAPSQATP